MERDIEHPPIAGSANEATSGTATPPRQRRPRKKKANNVAALVTSSNESEHDDSYVPNQSEKKKAPVATSIVVEDSKPPAIATENGPSKKPQAKKRPPPKQPWKEHLPADAVDPITLEPLDQLSYPPFALVATKPYNPVDWPLPGAISSNTTESENEVEWQRRVLQEQWGSFVTEVAQAPRHVNLFDGQVLAYYMVSQSQFIDPLNRRDLSRKELLHLDRYLRKHGFTSLNVTEAYDTKGIALSTAGAAAATAAGRSLMLQQEARLRLNSVFGDLRSSSPIQQPSNPRVNVLQQYYDAQNNFIRNGGFILVDDDDFPGLPGAQFRNIMQHSQPAPRATDFPSLSASVPADTLVPTDASAAPPQSAKKAAPKTQTLSKIGKLVQQTDPEEQQRQWEARELAQRKAMLANLTFGAIPSHITTIGISGKVGSNEAQSERNRTLADALGVLPSAVHVKTPGGWRRPTEAFIELDEFGNEVNATVYPDSLIKQAKELRLHILLKLEKKWSVFLDDDNAASLPLYPMERSVRAFVHEYAEFWKLHTESFDREPKRYIHCVKLRDTSAPYPLISDAMRHGQPSRLVTLDHSTQQTAGQSTISEREFPAGPARVPLSLNPRSTQSDSVASLTSAMIGVSISGAPSRAMEESAVNSRFSVLQDGRERPKLELHPRSLPLETPPETVPSVSIKPRGRYVNRRAVVAESKRRQRRALEAAFASDDEKDSDAE